jgi:hypothetical protein
MSRLHRLAMLEDQCRVVALTGDYVSTLNLQLPAEWDDWPQPVKLSVPGNHGNHSQAFARLSNWIHLAPWSYQVEDLLFIGLDLLSSRCWEQFISDLSAHHQAHIVGLVLLTHERPRPLIHTPLFTALANMVDVSRLLILHGDDHPGQFQSEWDDGESFGGRSFFRSNVCSSGGSNHWGGGHRITWRYRTFWHERVTAGSQ